MPDVERTKRARAWLAAIALGLLGVGLAVVRRETAPPEVMERRREPVPTTSEPRPAAPLLVAVDRSAVAPPEANAEARSDPLRPHPITPAHRRIFRENRLIGALNGALDVRDGPGVRRLLETYRSEFPEDPNALFAGYAIIADCLERPGDAATAAARKYYATETASTLRRYVRRICLTPELP